VTAVLEHEPLFEVPENWWRRRRCTVCGCALSVIHEWTYIVQRQGWVKIGATNKPRRRINELARPAWIQHVLSPPEMDWSAPLVALVVLGGDAEHDLHRDFVEQHVIGEWFLLDDVLEAQIRVFTGSGK